MKNTYEVGQRLVELVKGRKSMQAIDELYSPDILNVEAFTMPGTMSPETKGIAAVKAKNEWWCKNQELHSMDVSGPWPNGDRFIVMYKIDVTSKDGPMKGKRYQMEESALYTVKDGKIVKEEFFYPAC